MCAIVGQSRAGSNCMLGRNLADPDLDLDRTGSVVADIVAETVADSDTAASSASVPIGDIAGDSASVLADIEQRMQD